MSNCRLLLLAPAMSLCIGHASAQQVPVREASRSPLQFFPDLTEEQRLQCHNLALIAGEAVAVGLYGKRKWWRDGFTGKFRTVNEGWFGQHTYAGGADKLGHFYMNYATSRLAAKAFISVGNDPQHALMLAALTTFGTMTAVEIIDGYSKRWRFSKEDAIMNAFGAGGAVLLEKNPQLDRIVDFRLQYRASAANGREFDPFGDYAGQTYVVALKAAGVPELRDRPLLRYLELAVGYGARGFPDNRVNHNGERQRNLYVGISLNLAELLGVTAFKDKPQSRVRKLADTALEYVQVPGTAVYSRHTLPHD